MIQPRWQAVCSVTILNALNHSFTKKHSVCRPYDMHVIYQGALVVLWGVSLKQCLMGANGRSLGYTWVGLPAYVLENVTISNVYV